MKIALAQLNYVIGDFEHNSRKIIDHIHAAKKLSADLIVFAELSVCGYPPRDFLEFDDFIEQSEDSIKKIAAECIGIAAIVGAPRKNPDPKGKNLFNSAFLLAEGEIKFFADKTLLPTYDIFDEYRYFEPNRRFEVFEFKDKKIALTVCEDIWNTGPDPLYVHTPLDELSKLYPDLVINISASPFNYEQETDRMKVLKENVLKYKLPIVYVNQVGAQTELLFDGNSKIVDAQGNVVAQCKAFKEDLIVFDTEISEPPIIVTEVPKAALIYDALIMGMRDYFGKLGFRKAILGLSGGIDSAVTIALAAKALGYENVKAVLLPSQFSSQHSIDDAVRLAENLKVDYSIVPIKDAYDALYATMEPYFAAKPFDVTEENMQARVRAVILMAFSNKFGYILLNTSNKSEAAVGYGTLYGDMCGGISVLGDVYKTEIYELAHYINREKEIIPVNSITKPPSAELRPNQKDSDSLPEYDLLDKILYQYIEKRQSPRDIIGQGFDETLVRRVLKMVNMNEWKRHQTPPILRVSPKAFGSGRRMPIVGKYLS